MNDDFVRTWRSLRAHVQFASHADMASGATEVMRAQVLPQVGRRGEWSKQPGNFLFPMSGQDLPDALVSRVGRKTGMGREVARPATG